MKFAFDDQVRKEEKEVKTDCGCRPLSSCSKTSVLGDTLERSVSVLSLYLAVTSEEEETLSAYPVVILLSLGPKDEKKNYDHVSRSITMATH